jgi:uncharacterized protein (DUF1501 family)
MSRRNFLGFGAGLVTAAALPSWLPRVVYAAQENSERDVMVSIFLRGGADGLTLCPPHGDASYYSLRPTLALAPPDSSGEGRALDLDGFFGLPPAMEPLLEAWQEGSLALVHACGLPNTSRSHFDAMHSMEVGQEQPPASLFSGWLGRHLQATAPTMESALLRAVGIGFGLQRTLVGAPQSLPIADLANFGLAGDPSNAAERRGVIEAMYEALPGAFSQATQGTFDTIDLLKAIDFIGYQPTGGAVYPEGEFGASLASVAALIKAEVGVEAVAVDLGGWDTHDFQGPVDGGMAGLMNILAQGLAAFHLDLSSSEHSKVTTVAMSEFGRNAFENGSAGTDHGHGGLMLALGSAINGGQVLTDWPGLAPGQLYQEQDLAITIDYRDILSEILSKRLGNTDINAVFGDPSYTPVERGIVNV